MKPSDIFGVIVRTLGLLMAVTAIRTGLYWLRASSVLHAIMFGIPYLFITAYLIRGAPHLLKFSYPKAGAKEAND